MRANEDLHNSGSIACVTATVPMKSRRKARSIASELLAEAEPSPSVIVNENVESTEIGVNRGRQMDELSHFQEPKLRALMTASLDGDAAAYYELLQQLTPHLRAYYRHRFARIGHGLTDAEDLLQEALIAIHTHRHTYDQTQPFTPWVYAIARYKFLDYLRRTKYSLKDMPMESAEELIADSDMTAVDSGLDVQRLLVGIPSKAREAIQYVKLDGLSVSEAAARSGMSESAVKVAVHRGLKALALRIRQERGT
jgi:RNA polymerase sigma-70 factor, ECF subfamily